MKTNPGIACVLLVTCLGAPRLHAAPATAPAPDRSTPAKSLAVMIDAAQAEDYATVRATFAATSKPAVALADDMARAWVGLHHYHRVIVKYFPDQKPLIDDQNVHRKLEEMRTQLAKITFTIQGNHATTDTAAGKFLGDFVFDGHIWQIDCDRIENVENYTARGHG